MNTTSTPDNSSLDFAKLDVLARLDLIEAKLKDQDPELPMHLQSIHRALLENEELVHILPDEKIRTYMAGMQKYKQLQLVAEASKSRSSGGKRGKQTEDDF